MGKKKACFRCGRCHDPGTYKFKDAVCHKDVGFCHTNDAMAIYLLMFGVLGFCLAVLTFHLGSWMSERRNKHTNLNNANVESYQDIQSIQ